MRFIKPIIIGFVFSGSVLAAPLSILEAWQGFSSPDIISSGFTHNYYHLPAEGSTGWNGPKYWSSDYWPSKTGGINNRWYGRGEGFDYRSPGRNEVRRYSSNQMAALSPSEKFDLYNGRYDYPLKAEVATRVSPRAQDWEGICHGWVVATLHHNEPTPKQLRSVDGINIPFGSSDIKALLSYYYANDPGLADTVGRRCNFGQWTGGATECDQDLNAGAFHIIMTNKLGLRREGLIMDIERYAEVWNQPVIGYRTRNLGQFRPSRTAARTAVVELRMATEIWYIDETEPSWNTVHGTVLQKMDKKDVVYRIELNSRNEIVGGTWESEIRPDFIWQKSRAANFGGMFSRLGDLLNDYNANNSIYE